MPADESSTEREAKQDDGTRTMKHKEVKKRRDSPKKKCEGRDGDKDGAQISNQNASMDQARHAASNRLRPNIRRLCA